MKRELEATRRAVAGRRDAEAMQDAAESRRIQAFQDRAWRGLLESQAAEKHRFEARPGSAAIRQQTFDREQAARDLSIKIDRQAQEYRMNSGAAADRIIRNNPKGGRQ
jgi:hypothetical protein